MEQPAQEYTITAGNSGGSTLTKISIAVNFTAPIALTYSTTACLYTKDLVIEPNVPTVTGTVTSWSADPARRMTITLSHRPALSPARRTRSRRPRSIPS